MGSQGVLLKRSPVRDGIKLVSYEDVACRTDRRSSTPSHLAERDELKRSRSKEGLR